MIKVIVADDHAVVRTGLQLIFDNDPSLEIIDEVGRGNELLNKVREKDYDVVILDISMPGKDGIDVLKDLKLEKPHLPVVIFSMNPEDKFAVRLFQSGASAYINKETNPEELIKAVKYVAKGKNYYTPFQAELLMNSLNSPQKELPNPHESLTDREFQVMRMLAQGIKKSDIAETLSVSKNTISNHRNNILRKMNLSNNTELARYAVKHRLIE